MFPDVIKVHYLRDYQLELTFADGVTGTVDLAGCILGKGGVFAPLEVRDYFARVYVNGDIGTIAWPNDVDFDPEVLYSLVTGKPIPTVMPQAISGA